MHKRARTHLDAQAGAADTPPLHTGADPRVARQGPAVLVVSASTLHSATCPLGFWQGLFGGSRRGQVGFVAGMMNVLVWPQGLPERQ